MYSFVANAMLNIIVVEIKTERSVNDVVENWEVKVSNFERRKSIIDITVVMQCSGSSGGGIGLWEDRTRSNNG